MPGIITLPGVAAPVDRGLEVEEDIRIDDQFCPTHDGLLVEIHLTARNSGGATLMLERLETPRSE